MLGRALATTGVKACRHAAQCRTECQAPVGGRPHQCVIAPIGSVQGQAAATLAALCVRARMSL